MKHIGKTATSLFAAAVGVTLLAGCATGGPGNSPDPVDLTDSTVVTALCGDNAQDILDVVESAADAKPKSPHRKELEDWGLTKKEYKDDKFVASIIDQLEEQAKVDCDAIPSPTPTPSATSADTGPVSDALKAILDASRAPTDACIAIVKEQLGSTAVVNGVYTLTAPPAMVGPEPEDLKVKYGDPTALWWSSALDLSLQGNTPEEKMADLELKICTHPSLGVALRHLFANLTLQDGTRVLDLQKTDWLTYGLVPQEQLNDQVDDYIPLLYIDDAEADLDEDELYNLSAAQARLYETMASKLVYLISHYQLGTVMPINSHYSYEVAGGGLSADQMPEIRVTTALDARPALVFYLTEKTACAPLMILGFNVGDSRPELTTEGYTCDQVSPPPVECDSAHPCGTHGCPPGWWWNGYICLQGKLHSDDVTYDGGGNWDQQGNDGYTSGTEGTGNGTSGNAGTNGSSGSGTTTGADGAGTGTTTATGGDTTGATGTGDQQTTTDNPGGISTDPDKQ